MYYVKVTRNTCDTISDLLVMRRARNSIYNYITHHIIASTSVNVTRRYHEYHSCFCPTHSLCRVVCDNRIRFIVEFIFSVHGTGF